MTSLVDNTVIAGTTYYYVATSVDQNSVESVYSNQLTAAVPSFSVPFFDRLPSQNQTTSNESPPGVRGESHGEKNANQGELGRATIRIPQFLVLGGSA